jgi:hypothetical protein
MSNKENDRSELVDDGRLWRIKSIVNGGDACRDSCKYSKLCV